jgi:DNA (cytosine-5)-methyltransferase 1
MRELFDSGDRPPVIVIENVLGLLYGENFKGLCEALAALGMQFGAAVIDAKHFVPQSRPRVFIVAVDSRIDCRQCVSNGPAPNPWFPKSLLSAVSLLPENLRPAWRWWKFPAPLARVSAAEDLIEPDREGMQWHSAAETKRLLRMMTPANLHKVKGATSLGGRSVGMLYKRIRSGEQRAEIRFDGLAGCLRTPNGGSSRQTVVVIENGRVKSRLLTPREAARLMGVPDEFHLPEKYNDAYRAMGDGVAVPAVAWLSKNLLVPLVKLCRGADHKTRGQFGTGADGQLVSLRRIAEARAAEWERLGS